MAHSTNYFDTFIAVAPDTRASAGLEPKVTANPTVARRMFEMLHLAPYRHTSDAVLFGVHVDRKAIAARARPAARREFFSKPLACLRASPLPKSYGWGIHFDHKGRIALVGMETEAYAALAAGRNPMAGGASLTVKAAMRSKRRATG